MKWLKIFIFLICLFAGLFFFHERLLGMLAEPFLAKVMTNVFDMPVTVKGLRIHVRPWHVSAEEIQCLNPPGFRRRDHYTARGIDLDLDLTHLKNKYIRITKAHFNEAIFAIESYMTPEGSQTNVWHWYHHMGLDEEDTVPAVPHPSPAPDNFGEDCWRVRIDRLDLDKGSVIFDDRRDVEEHQWIFQDLKGYWTGFDFLSDYVSPVFTEYIKLEGTFGKNPPAVFRGEGKCQFADGDNFDVEAEALNGSVGEYYFLLEGLPGEVRDGTFDLKSKVRCVEGNLDSMHQLTLEDLKFKGANVGKQLMQYPFDTVLLLLQNQKTVELDMRVDGYIGDPKFRFFSAFTKALQKSLLTKAKTTLKGVGKGTLMIAAEAPHQVKNGIEKIGEFLTGPFANKNNKEMDSTVQGETNG